MDEYLPVLRDIFPNKSLEQINEVIQLVCEENLDEYAYKLEGMINLLAESGDSTLCTNQNNENDDEGAVGYARVNNTDLNHYFEQLTCLFPDASRDFLWNILQENSSAELDFDDIVDQITTEGYTKQVIDPLTIWEQLKLVLPKADPAYLKKEANILATKSKEEVDSFVQNAMESNDYPTLKDYLKNKKEHDELSIYTRKFSAHQFLEVIPNPSEHFSDALRAAPLLGDNVNEDDINYALNFLYNHYRFLRKKYIDQTFDKMNKNLFEVCNRLDRMPKFFRTPRHNEEGGETRNMPLLQEIAFLKHKRQIIHVLKMKDEKYRQAKEEARKFNLLENCKCCFMEELIPEECYFCLKNCVFCKDCIRNGTAVSIGRGDLEFPCFSCDSKFSLRTLQMTIDKKIFENLARKIQVEEIKNANLEGLEGCPHCDFVMVLPENAKIFKCENIECMRETCLECRHDAHVPLRCDEIEYDEDVQRRTFIENRMSEALIRTCPSCRKTFIKEHGCNKMTCHCGTKMCYVCGIVVKDYSHFGSDRCPLYTDDLNRFHLENVQQGAATARAELGGAKVKFDPTANLEQFFQ